MTKLEEDVPTTFNSLAADIAKFRALLKRLKQERMSPQGREIVRQLGAVADEMVGVKEAYDGSD